MSNKKFLGYKRENGEVGIRNHVLVLPIIKDTQGLAKLICDIVNGATYFNYLAENGRTSHDREIIFRTLSGLSINPNVASVLLITKSEESGYPELKLERFVKLLKKNNKKFEVLNAENEGGFYNSLGKGVELTRNLIVEASKLRRQECDISDIKIAVKCGISDNTSGLSGNPVVGNMFDKVIDGGGTAFFSETTEIIGAEKLLSKRCINEEVAEKLLQAVRVCEEKALSVGEDIRTINPIPQNIEGGISTLEEKSLGAIVKSGTKEIQDVLTYAERPKNPGLYFIDGWMSGSTLPVGYAASGAQMMIFQMGGLGMKGNKPPMVASNTGIVIPIMYATGNDSMYERAIDNMDFNSSGVYTKNESISSVGDKLLDKVLDIYSGTSTKNETLNFQDQVEMDLQGPNF